jgi:hypothetical protein
VRACFLLRVGTFSSSLFIGVKYGNDLRYAILHMLKAKSDSIQRAVAALEAAKGGAEPFAGRTTELSSLFEREKIAAVLEGAQHSWWFRTAHWLTRRAGAYRCRSASSPVRRRRRASAKGVQRRHSEALHHLRKRHRFAGRKFGHDPHRGGSVVHGGAIVADREHVAGIDVPQQRAK